MGFKDILYKIDLFRRPEKRLPCHIISRAFIEKRNGICAPILLRRECFQVDVVCPFLNIFLSKSRKTGLARGDDEIGMDHGSHCGDSGRLRRVGKGNDGLVSHSGGKENARSKQLGVELKFLVNFYYSLHLQNKLKSSSFLFDKASQ